MCAKWLQSCPTLATLWTVAHQAPLSMGFSRQEYWSGLPCPPPGDLPHPGIEPASLMSPALADRFFTTSATWEAQKHTYKDKVKSLSRVQLFGTPWTLAYQAPQSMWFSRQVLEWVAISFSRGSSQPRDRTQVSRIVDRRFAIWDTKEIKTYTPVYY